MPILLLLRHAKSDWAEFGLADHDRPLSPRGERAAAALARYFRRTVPAPDLVLCSSARRTVDTLTALRPALPAAVPVRVTEALYEVGAGAILDQLRRVEDTVGVLLVVGHNPGMAGIALSLAGPEGDPEALRALALKFPTGGLATLELDGTWRDLSPGIARLTGFIRPRDLE